MCVDPEVQGSGVGSAMMKHFCTNVEAAKMDAYLETGKKGNVPFYQHFGFAPIN